MPTAEQLYGDDLQLLLPVVRGSSEDAGHDLVTAFVPGGKDLAVVRGVPNLEQALTLRFITPVGALAPLGHPDYGCRLEELIGKLNNDTNGNLAKLFVLLALAAEPRVKDVLSVDVTQSPRDPTEMDIAITLLPIDSQTPLNMVFSFSLAGGPTP